MNLDKLQLWYCSWIQRWALTHHLTRTRKLTLILPLPDKPSSVPMPGDLILLTNHLSECIVTADHIKVWTDKDLILSRVRRVAQVGWTLSVQTLFHISRMKASYV